MLHFLYGFIARDSGSKDVFAHDFALERPDISTLGEGQAVVVGVRGPKGGPEPKPCKGALGLGRGRRSERRMHQAIG